MELTICTIPILPLVNSYSPEEHSILIKSHTTIGSVFRNMVPHVSPRPNAEHRSDSFRSCNCSFRSVTISMGMEEPPKLPKFRILQGTFAVSNFSFFTILSMISLLKKCSLKKERSIFKDIHESPTKSSLKGF